MNKAFTYTFTLLLLAALTLTILSELCILNFSTPITIWTILLVLVTFYYAHTTFQILNNQNKAEKIKWFQQIFLSIKPDYIIADQIKIRSFKCEFRNISEGIAINCRFKMYEGDSLVDLKDNELSTSNTIDIGAIPSNFPLEYNIMLDKELNLRENEIKRFRVFLEYTNPIKIENGLYYILTCIAESREKVSCTVKLVDFNNGLSRPNLRKIRKMAINEQHNS